MGACCSRQTNILLKTKIILKNKQQIKSHDKHQITTLDEH